MKEVEMMKPIIGIIGNEDYSYLEKNCISVFENYRKAIIEYGGIPILILPPQLINYHETQPKDNINLTEEQKNDLIRQIKLCNGILIPGGHKIFEYHKFICKYCNKNNMPLLGICMGMQTMCNYNNNNINIKIEDGSHKSDDDYVHYVKIKKDSKLYEILGEDKILVNSFHNYQVPNSGDYKTVGICDNIIEAVEKKEDLFNIGLQWHPEKNYDKDLNSKKIFKAFIKETKKYKNN